MTGSGCSLAGVAGWQGPAVQVAYVAKQSGVRDDRPVVLLLATSEWVSTARLAMALAGTGCRVELVGSRTHPALATSAIARRHRYDPLRPLRSLRAALRSSGATALVPVDEVMVGHLEELWHQAAAGSALRAVAERSTGGLKPLQAAASRMSLLRTAVEAGVRVPETLPVTAESDLKQAAIKLHLPMVLKSDASSGGRGVRVAETLDAAAAAWRGLHRPPGLVRALKRGVVGRDWTHLRPWGRKETRGVTAQRFMRGGERTAMAVCLRGEVLALVCLEVVETWKQRGPSSVVRLVHDAAMERAVRAVAGSVQVSGFCGFDFMTEPETGEPLLIEMNPRPTQLAHLPLGEGKDLVAAFVRAVVGLDAGDRPAATAGEVVALFPQELQRDPASAWLGTAFHDVPWGEPELVRQALTVAGGAASLSLPEPLARVDATAGPQWQVDTAAKGEFAR